MAATKDQVRDYARTRWQTMETAAVNWRRMVRNAAMFVAPSDSQIMRWATPNERIIDGNLYDVTAIQANNVLAAGQLAYLTPINEVWFNYSPRGVMDGDEDAVKWYATCSQIAREVLAQSNFYQTVHEVFLARGWAGTAAMLCEMNEDNRLWFKYLDPGWFYISENARDVVDCVSREIVLTHREALQLFGEENLPQVAKEAVKQNKPTSLDNKLDYVQLIFKRPDEWRSKSEKGEYADDGANKPYADVYFCKDSGEVCRDGGYDEFPVFVTRWKRMRGEEYGISPAMEVLPEIRELNYARANSAMIAELAAKGRYLVPDNLDGQVDWSPGGQTVFDSNRPDSKPVNWGPSGNQAMSLLEEIRDMRAVVNAAFLTDKFQVFTDSTKRMTAYESMQLADEKLSLFHPAFASFIDEFLNPLHARIFSLLLRKGLFPPPPASVMQFARKLGDPNLVLPRIVYLSKIALAVQAVTMKGSYQLLQLVPTLNGFDPRVSLQFDFVKMARGFSRVLNVPEGYIRAPEEVAKLQKEQEAMQQQQQLIAMAQQGAAAAKDAAQAGLFTNQQEGVQ